MVDGVFLEIGIVPNTAPVKALLKLNTQGEIPIHRDQSTDEHGLLTAGDVTDETEKQMIVAAEVGVKAARSAHRYLLENKLIANT
jgi:alkyl hydroperoxide reductase subunit AhpF